MVSLQIISKILQSQTNTIVEDNLLTPEYFVGYEDEFNFIQNHYKTYGNIPDKSTFISKFPDFEITEVTESDKYLVDTIREEYLYYRIVPVLQTSANLMKTDSNSAAQYLLSEIKNIQPSYGLGGTDIISQASERFEHFTERLTKQDDWFFTTGFEELDDLIHGLQRGEEFFVLFARTNQGKSWILEKICTHVWSLGFNVGYMSPEMGADSIGYRFDTLYRNFSNSGLMWGKRDIDIPIYEDYIGELSQSKSKFVVSVPSDFDRKVTVSKLRNWIKQYKLDMIAIDGITYLTDERGKRGDNKTTTLTNVSEDLMELSIELGVPILVVVQANRGQVDEVPDLENIRDSDGIAHNATKVVSIRQKKNGVLTMIVKKQRNGPVGGELSYTWDIDKGDFTFLPSYDDAQDEEVTQDKVIQITSRIKDTSDVF